MQLHYQAYGEAGHPLLILHGLLGESGNWHTLGSRAFAEHFRVYALDQRNHGRSPHTDVFDYPSMAADVVAFMESQGLGSAHLLGHSMGGKTAMHVALAHPERVDRLVVVDMAPRAYRPHHAELLEALRSLDLASYSSRGEIDTALARQVPSAPIRQFLLKNLSYDKDTGTYRWQMNLEGIYHNYENLNAAVENHRTFEGPVLFVRGGNSEYVRDEDTAAIKNLFPEARIATVPGAGHWVHAEAPKAFAQIVTDFLREE